MLTHSLSLSFFAVAKAHENIFFKYLPSTFQSLKYYYNP